ncbi:MAG: MFS transporter, partial [Chloroflexota bacterium]|nr:MFS transporter [Chloroflexota bacterium]
MSVRRPPRFFYGYAVVAAIFFTSLFMFGAFTSFGIFFKPMSSELGWTRAMTSGAFSLAYVVMGFGNFGAGRLTDRFGPKAVLVTCGLLLGLSYILMSQIGAIWQMYLFYGLLTGAGMSGGDTPVLATLARWFVKRRGTFTGIAKLGAGVGILTVPALVNWLILGSGWRQAFVIVSIISLVGVVTAAMFLKRDPAAVGQLPDGDTEMPEKKAGTGASRQFSLREVTGTSQFWIFAGVWFVLVFCVQVVLIHIANHVTDLGISATVAAAVVSTIGGFSLLGRGGIGYLSDRIKPKYAFILAIVFLIGAMVLVQFARQAWAFYFFAAMYGVAHGAIFTVISPVLAELFGLRAIGSIIGAIIMVGTVGGAIGPLVAGRIFDVTGSYQAAFLIILGFSIIA